MPGYYEYLISSLPMLHFGMKPPFSFERFLDTCQGLISEDDMAILRLASIHGPYNEGSDNDVLLKWRGFDTALRNELVRIRSPRKKADPAKYIRGDGYADPSIVHVAMSAYREASLAGSERMLDQARWNYLNELQVGNFFNLESLLIYVHKLLMLERWAGIETADKSVILEEALARSR